MPKVDKRIFYDSIAEQFDNVMNPYEVNKRLNIIFSRLLSDDLSGKLALDIGCGTGKFSARLIEHGARVVSSDIGHNLVMQSLLKSSSAWGVQSSLENLGLASNTFDVVICTEVIEHTPSPLHSVHELLRVLKPGGLLILTVPHKLWRFSVTVADWLKIRPYAGYENWVGRRELGQWVKEAGGSIEQMIGFNLFPLFYKPFYPLLDMADRYKAFYPLMVNIGLRVRKDF
jgi:2-polyprenyl-6-hydroxyphenyl methylase/3-demethylubiquinone-9 3-methyltransferase